jgi:tetratricopeptide (TPR) repeat protein
MKFQPPYRKQVPRDLYEIYKNVLEGGYIFQDMMLERMITLAGEETTVIIVSDHGFLSGDLRPKRIPKIPAGPAIEHRTYGMICMQGEHIKKDELIFGATLLDITPTILTLFGLPAASDMRGKPLVQVFEEKINPQIIESWEDIQGETGEHSKDELKDPWAEQEALKQLIELGYIDPTKNEDMKNTVENATRESKYYLATVYVNIKKFDKALPLLKDIFMQYPKKLRYGFKLIQCYLDLNMVAEAMGIVKKMDSLVSENSFNLNYFRIKIMIAENREAEALLLLEKIKKKNFHLPEMQVRIGAVYFELKQIDKAQECFENVLQENDDNALVHHLLARIYLSKKLYKKAVEQALISVGLIHFNPAAHYHLGEALLKMGNYADAEKAFLMAISQAPGMKKAYKRLIDLYDNIFKKVNESQKYQKLIEKI